ncbi:MAG: UDP-N-acetylmuramoyl-L-alanine--D-glutamate ligase [Bryobacteraceae bacterium]
MTILRVEGISALVVGMERSGVASVELLARRGARVTATDLEAKAGETLEKLGVKFELQRPEVFEGRDAIVLSPGVPAGLPELEQARRKGAEVIGEVELASRFLRGPILGITGSNGKTTTTALVGHILGECGVAAQVGGNIGRAATAMVDSSRPDQWNVLELSSFQLETVRDFRARIGVCLNVTPDHLDRHRTFEAYAAAKRRLVESADRTVLNADDAVCAGWGTPRTVWFSLTQSGDVCLKGDWIEMNGRPVLNVNDLPIRGRHNVENAMAAMAASGLAGADASGMGIAITTFRAVEHRLEFTRRVHDVDYYNDSKATNVDAALKAIDAFGGGLWVILGGKDKGSDYAPLREPLRTKARAALLIGAAAPKIASQIAGAVELVDAGTLDHAVREAARRAAPGETVLLAPACASFDQFENYEHRGRVFKQIVEAMED